MCAVFWVDTNGLKQPNKWGLDTFYFAIGNDGFLYPYGSNDWAKAGPSQFKWWRDDPVQCGKVDNSAMSEITGMGCPARLMEEGWKITYW